MKSIKLDQDGDAVIVDNQLQLIEGIDLIAQTVKQVLGTNIGEWFGDNEEGIDFSVILTKNPNFDLIQDTINTAVQQVADGLGVELETDNFTFEVKGRELAVSFTLTVGGNEEETTTISVTL